MPKKRRIPKLRHRAALTLDELTILEQLCLLAGWRPPTPQDDGFAEARWRTWAEFVSAYEDVRDELLANFPGEAPFAERVRAVVTSRGLAVLGVMPHETLRVYQMEV